MIKQYSPEVVALLERVRAGDRKLIRAWQQLRNITDREAEWNEQMERWHQANVKLSALCTELQVKGFNDCLYLINGRKTKKCLEPGDSPGCCVCPSTRAWWNEELMDLPSASQKEES